jgi:hypothetical protein
MPHYCALPKPGLDFQPHAFLYFRVFPFLIIHVYHFYLCMVWDYFEMSYQIRLWKESLNTDLNKRIITSQFNKKNMSYEDINFFRCLLPIDIKSLRSINYDLF